MVRGSEVQLCSKNRMKSHKRFQHKLGKQAHATSPVDPCFCLLLQYPWGWKLPWSHWELWHYHTIKYTMTDVRAPPESLLSLLMQTCVLTCTGHNQAFHGKLHVSTLRISSILIGAGQIMHKHSLGLIKANYGQHLRSQDVEACMTTRWTELAVVFSLGMIWSDHIYRGLPVSLQCTFFISDPFLPSFAPFPPFSEFVCECVWARTFHPAASPLVCTQRKTDSEKMALKCVVGVARN